MRTHFRLLALGFLPLMLGSCGRECSTPPEILSCFERIVEVLDSTTQYRNLFDLKMADYKRKASEATSDEARFYYYKLITDDYYEFDKDSAEYYIARNLALAEKNNKPEWMVDSYLQAAHLYNKIGSLEQAKDALDAILPLNKTTEQHMQYYLHSIDYWSNRAIFLNLPNPDPMSQRYADSILQMGNIVPRPLQLHAKVWLEDDDHRKVEVIKELKQAIDRMPSTDPWYSKLCEEVGLLSHILHTSEKDEVEYLTRHIVTSVQNVSRSTPQLAYVEQIAIRYGELDFANRFLTALVKMQMDFPDKLRAPLYASVFEVNDAVQQRIESEAKRNFALAVVALLMAVITAVLLGFLIYALRRRARLQHLLKEKNDLLEQQSAELRQEQAMLKQLNDALQQTGEALKYESDSLQEANYVKEEYIGQMFAMCSEYLQKIENVKRDINRKLTARQYDLALKATKIKSDDDMKELHELWSRFDDVFLTLFPDFVERFNELLRPDEHIVLRPGEKLNTDLRIYALVRLGINNSVKIAKILGLSTQSVYNARQKMRARATESEVDFPARVRQLAMDRSSRKEPEQ